MIDKDIQQFAILNMMGAIVASPHAFAAAKHAAEHRGQPIEVAVRDLATSLAVAGLKQVDETDMFQLPSGCPASEVLQLFLSVSADNLQMQAFEDTLQEGELGSNAAALVLNEPGYWHGAQPDSDEMIPFPGTGEPVGPGRVNDLIRAAALLLAEAGRVERAMEREDSYATEHAAQAEAVLPGVAHDAEAVLAAEQAGADPDTRH